MAAYCPQCARGEVHDCQLVDRPIKPRFHTITMYTNAAGDLVTDVDMYLPAVSP